MGYGKGCDALLVSVYRSADGLVVAGAWWACVMRVWRVRGLVAGAWWACVMQGDALACAWFGG